MERGPFLHAEHPLVNDRRWKSSWCHREARRRTSWRVMCNGVISPLSPNPMGHNILTSLSVHLLGLTSCRFRAPYTAEWERFPLRLVSGSLSFCFLPATQPLFFLSATLTKRRALLTINQLIPEWAGPSTGPTSTYFCCCSCWEADSNGWILQNRIFGWLWGCSRGLKWSHGYATFLYLLSVALSSFSVSTYIYVPGSLSSP